MSEPLTGIQVGAVSFVDEGVEKVLDTFQELAHVNALSLSTPTWTRGTGGRQLPNHPLPDHGVQEYDLDWRGGSYTAIHPQFYAHTSISTDFRAKEHGDWDMFEAVIPQAQKRRMQCYAWMEVRFHRTPPLSQTMDRRAMIAKAIGCLIYQSQAI